MRLRPLVLLFGLLSVFAAASVVSAGDAPTAKTWRRTMRQVLPNKDELRWRKVEWHGTLWDAVVEAHEAKKPILLWAMNGHALACT